MKIYTRKGDDGSTGLLGGERLSKGDPRVQAYGAVDELNTHLGLALALGGAALPEPERVRELQGDLLAIGARLAADDPKRASEKGLIPELAAGRVRDLESWIDQTDSRLPELDAFLLPGGAPAAAQLQVARTVCRRAERAICKLLEDQPELGDVVLPYMNRLSDLLFVLARTANRAAGTPDREWEPQRRSRARPAEEEA